MSRFTYTATTGQVATSEVEIIVRPRSPSDGRAKRGVILAHGAGQQTINQWSTPDVVPGFHAVLMMLGSLGFYVLTCDLGGQYTFDNDTVTNASTGRVLAAWNVLKTLGCKTDKPIGLGISMGFGNLVTAAGRGAVAFSGIAGIVGLADLDDVRDNNRGGLKAVVNTAYGFPVGGTSGSNPFPSYANPNTTGNAANIVSNCPKVYMSYSSGDTTILPATVTSLGTKLGSAATLRIHGTQDHSDGSVMDAVTGANLTALTAFLASVA